MRLLAFLVLILISTILPAQNMVEHHVYPIKLKLNQPYFSEMNIREVRVYEQAEGESKFLSKVQYFDRNGRLTKELKLDFTGNDTTTTSIAYDEDGHVTKMIISHPFFGDETAIFSYGADGKLHYHERGGRRRYARGCD